MFTIPGLSIDLATVQPGEKADPKTVAARMDNLFMRNMLEALSEDADPQPNQWPNLPDPSLYASILRQQPDPSPVTTTEAPTDGPSLQDSVAALPRSEEHTSELQSHSFIS